jgi:hypothetical protein
MFEEESRDQGTKMNVHAPDLVPGSEAHFTRAGMGALSEIVALSRRLARV